MEQGVERTRSTVVPDFGTSRAEHIVIVRGCNSRCARARVEFGNAIRCAFRREKRRSASRVRPYCPGSGSAKRLPAKRFGPRQHESPPSHMNPTTSMPRPGPGRRCGTNRAQCRMRSCASIRRSQSGGESGSGRSLRRTRAAGSRNLSAAARCAQPDRANAASANSSNSIAAPTCAVFEVGS